uniref:LSM domain-containing protein 1 n=1 Tax=Lepeophtheirus salmonis TaxID=72036 RepID=C1BSQ0_LEPSM|nr:LSM domain-containing protein 1 [Lepeophtheirus salmonis]
MPEEEVDGRKLLNNWLKKSTVIHLSDGRHVEGTFLCTDRDANVILSACTEYVEDSAAGSKFLGLVLVPGKHIKSIYIDVKDTKPPFDENVGTGNDYYDEENMNSLSDVEATVFSKIDLI